GGDRCDASPARRRPQRVAPVWRCRALMLTVLALVLAGPAHADDPASQEERGKRLYDKGEAAAGARVTAAVGQTSVVIPATRVPCASCHGSDGRGRPDAGVIPSNITWANLTKPYGLRHANGRSHP